MHNCASCTAVNNLRHGIPTHLLEPSRWPSTLELAARKRGAVDVHNGIGKALSLREWRALSFPPIPYGYFHRPDVQWRLAHQDGLWMTRRG